MQEILNMIIGFSLALGVIVALHEFGHLIAAKLLGVKVIRYSIGFGKILWRFKGKGIDQTEYAISAVPLGGYVKLLDKREGEVDEAEAHREFTHQHPFKRILILAAGAVFNFILAIFLYFMMYSIGVEGIVPYLAKPVDNTPAAVAGITEGEKILKVNNIEVKTWQSARFAILNQAVKNEKVILSTEDKNGQYQKRILFFDKDFLKQEDEDILENMGLDMLIPQSIPIIAKVMADGPAAQAGLQKEDEILKVNGMAIDNTQAFLKIIQENPDKPLLFEVKREGSIINITVTPLKEQQEDGSFQGKIQAAIAAKVPDEIQAQFFIIERHNPIIALGKGVVETQQTIMLTFRVLGKLVTGQASLKNISGPLTIAYYAGQTFTASMIVFLNFIALISISIGVVNLLPVPLLDGGHIVFTTIEWAKGSPLSEKIEIIAYKIGIALLASLMLLAFYNDIVRFFT